MSTITGTGGTHTPDLFMLYNTSRDSGNSVDVLLDGSVAIQLGAARARHGRFRAFFVDVSDAVALEDELSVAQVLTLVETDRPPLSMDFVVDGRGSIDVDIDERTRNHWTVTWDFYEVVA